MNKKISIPIFVTCIIVGIIPLVPDYIFSLPFNMSTNASISFLISPALFTLGLFFIYLSDFKNHRIIHYGFVMSISVIMILISSMLFVLTFIGFSQDILILILQGYSVGIIISNVILLVMSAEKIKPYD